MTPEGVLIQVTMVSLVPQTSARACPRTYLLHRYYSRLHTEQNKLLILRSWERALTPDPPDIDRNNVDVVLSPSNSLGNPELGDDLAPPEPGDTSEDTGPERPEPPLLPNSTAPSSSLKDLRDR